MNLINHTECSYCIGKNNLSYTHKVVVDYLYNCLYSEIKEPEITLYHGTYLKNLNNILRDGFKLDYCEDISFGRGIYLTPCPHLASSFTDSIILECAVKPGKIKYFNSFCCKKGCDKCRHDKMNTCNALLDLTEYNISDMSRISIKSVLYTQ